MEYAKKPSSQRWGQWLMNLIDRAVPKSVPRPLNVPDIWELNDRSSPEFSKFFKTIVDNGYLID